MIFPPCSSDVVMIGNPGCNAQLLMTDGTSILLVSLKKIRFAVCIKFKLAFKFMMVIDYSD